MVAEYVAMLLKKKEVMKERDITISGYATMNALNVAKELR
jgi:hypothetical protein